MLKRGNCVEKEAACWKKLVSKHFSNRN